MDIIPVLDLMQGLVVRGVAGERDSYQPVKSRLTDSSDAIEVANAVHHAFGTTEFYVADLDAIVSGKPNQQIVNGLSEAGFTLQLDLGVRSVEHVQSIQAADKTSVIVALESIESFDAVASALDRWGPKRTVFSVDLKHGSLLGQPAGLKTADPQAVVDQVVDMGIKRVILLDLAAVGMGTGIPTLDFCRTVHIRHPELQITTGGGVSSFPDLRAADEAHANGLLIASALHDGRITPADLSVNDWATQKTR